MKRLGNFRDVLRMPRRHAGVIAPFIIIVNRFQPPGTMMHPGLRWCITEYSTVMQGKMVVLVEEDSLLTSKTYLIVMSSNAGCPEACRLQA